MRKLILASILLTVACTNKLGGSVQLDGAAWTATHCRSGVAYGFSGVQFEDGDGKRLRVVADPVTNTVRVALFAPGATKGEDVGACATLEQRPQSSNVNGIQNQQGSVTFNCDGVGHKLSGRLTFENCH
jgi:hypothetical protein